MRALLLLLAAVPLAAQVQPMSPFQQQKARALLRDHLPCLGCHELDGTGGRTAPSLTGVGGRRGAAYVRAMIEDPQATLPGAAMPRTPMPASERELVIAFFSQGTTPDASARKLEHAAAAAPRAPQDGVAPAVLYTKWCSSCHGARGAGDGPNAANLPVPPAVHASAAQMSLRSDDALFDAIAGGGNVMGKSARMPAFGATLSVDEIRALVGYIRTLCACSAPAWSRDGSR